MSKETAVEPNKHVIPALSNNSLPADPSDKSFSNADTLFDWLGSFWAKVYEDPEFIQYMQGGRALRIAQLYLDLLENLKLKDRENAPVFHRERWHPVVIRKSMRNKGSVNLLRLGAETEAKLGKQDGTTIYPENTMFQLGSKDVSFKGMVVYPLDSESIDMVDSMVCATNNISDATVVLSKGRDFDLLDGAIAFAEHADPFTGDNADDFSKFEILADDPNDNDVETVVWVSDAMFDKDFIYRNLGYAMRIPHESSELYKRIVNAAWNTVADGGSPMLVKALVATLCGIPVVKTEGETVEKILGPDSSDTGGIQVITDKNVYDLSKYAELRSFVVRGAKLSRFDTLDKAIRVYPCVNDPDTVANYNDFVESYEEFTKDVPAIDLPPAMFRPSVDDGFSVDWAEKDVVCVGFDANGNPKLKFDIGGSEEDNDVFWEDTWENYEEAGVSMETCLEGLEYDKIFAVGKVAGKISPMKFFMKNLVGANTLIITVRTDTLADDAPLYDPKFFNVVRECIPAYLRLYVIEHEKIQSDADYYNSEGSDISDEADSYAYDEYDDDFDLYSKRGPRGRDKVSSKWVAACRDEYDDED